MYGDDDRTEVYEVDDPALSELAKNALVALVPSNRLLRPASGGVTVVAPDLATAFELCDGQRFGGQPTAADCSGVLIDRDLVLTAGHCFEDENSCDFYSYVFDYYYSEEGELEQLTSNDVYGCKRVIARRVSKESAAVQIDFAIVQLDRLPLGRKPVPLRTLALTDGDPLTTIGFASGLPAKVDRGAVVVDARTAVKDYFQLDSDTFAGSSGSGIFDVNRELVGVLVRGGEDYVFADGASCYIPNVVAKGDDGSPWEQATYVKHALDALCERGFPSVALCDIAPRCGDGFCTPGEGGGECAEDCAGSCGERGCSKSADRAAGFEPSETSADAGPDQPADAGVGSDEPAGEEKGGACSVGAGDRGLHASLWLAVPLALLARRRRQTR